MWGDQKHREIKGGTKENTRLISAREIRREQSSDYIAVTGRGTGRSGRKRLPFPGSPGGFAAVLHMANQQPGSPKSKIHKRNSNKKLAILQSD